MKKLVAVGVVCLCLGACSTVVEGTSQDIEIATDPDGAKCELIRDGKSIAFVELSPQIVKISKSKNNIKVVCNKTGYKEGTALNSSSTATATAGNLLIGGLIGVGVDYASGAAYKYEPRTFIKLIPENKDKPHPQVNSTLSKPTS